MKIKIYFIGLIVHLLISFTSCSRNENNNDEPKSSTLTALPTVASSGNVVKLYDGILNNGTSDASVTVNGQTAQIVNSTNNAIYVQIPKGVTSGSMVVKANGSTSTLSDSQFTVVPNRVFIVGSSISNNNFLYDLYEVSLSDYSLTKLHSLANQSGSLFTIPWLRTLVSFHRQSTQNTTSFENYHIDNQTYTQYITSQINPPFISLNATQTLYNFVNVNTEEIGAYTIDPSTMKLSTSPQFSLQTNASLISGTDITNDDDLSLFFQTSSDSYTYCEVGEDGEKSECTTVETNMNGTLTSNPFSDVIYALVEEHIIKFNTESKTNKTLYKGDVMMVGITFVSNLNSILAIGTRFKEGEGENENILIIYNVETDKYTMNVLDNTISPIKIICL